MCNKKLNKILWRLDLGDSDYAICNKDLHLCNEYEPHPERRMHKR